MRASNGEVGKTILLRGWLTKTLRTFPVNYNSRNNGYGASEGQTGRGLQQVAPVHRPRPLPHQRPQRLLVAPSAGHRPRRTRSGEVEVDRADTPVGLAGVDDPQQPQRVAPAVDSPWASHPRSGRALCTSRCSDEGYQRDDLPGSGASSRWPILERFLQKFAHTPPGDVPTIRLTPLDPIDAAPARRRRRSRSRSAGSGRSRSHPRRPREARSSRPSEPCPRPRR